MMVFLTLRKLLLLATPLYLASRSSNAALPDGRMHGNLRPRPAIPVVDAPTDGPVTSRNGTVLPPYTTIYTFDQLIDHTNPSLGTFKQRFYHTYEFYEPGGPIIAMTPGEVAFDGYSGYLTNATINGQIAQQQNGATIVLEHRFYGLSNPFPDLSVQSFRVHTIQQAIDDWEYFAQNVALPMPGGDKLGPNDTAWIMVGGSYSGALTSFTMVNKPGLFYIGYASSAVVQNIIDFWGYFEPIRQNMPKNCSADVEAVITHVDSVFSSNDASAITSLKNNFGLGAVTHLDDAAGALRNNLWDWQAMAPDSGPGAQFFQFCDALEVKNGVKAPAAGWGLNHALEAWGSYWRTTYLARLCGNTNAEDCLGSYDLSQSFWNDTTINNSGRSWMWIVCNEVGFFQEGAPVGTPSLVSRLVQPPYDERQCKQMFEDAFPTPPVPRVNVTNALYDGWNVNIDRLFFATGQSDPWREATMSADGLNVKSTVSQPIAESDGFHCSDLGTTNGLVDATVKAVQTKALASIKTWMAAYKPSTAVAAPSKNVAQVDSRQPSSISVSKKPLNAWFKGFGGH